MPAAHLVGWGVVPVLAWSIVLTPCRGGVAFFSGESPGGLVLLTDRNLRAQESAEAEKE